MFAGNILANNIIERADHKMVNIFYEYVYIHFWGVGKSFFETKQLLKIIFHQEISNKINIIFHKRKYFEKSPLGTKFRINIFHQL